MPKWLLYALAVLGATVLILSILFGCVMGWRGIEKVGYETCKADMVRQVKEAEKAAAPAKAQAEAKASEDKIIRSTLVETVLLLQKSDPATQQAAHIAFKDGEVRLGGNEHGVGVQTLYFVYNTETGRIVDLQTVSGRTAPQSK